MLTLGSRRLTTAGAAVLALLLAVLMAGCNGATDDDTSDASTTSAPPTATEPPPAPPTGTCYQMSFDEALSPTAAGEERPCRRPHATETYHVGRLDLVAGGHQSAVDSEQVQQQVATACPAALPRFLGGDLETLRLSMIRPVWFTPTLEESDLGADWFRCDVAVVARDEALVPLTGSLKRALAAEGGLDRYAMCGTAAPDSPKFERVVCSAEHSWRAISVVPLTAQKKYPGEAAVRQRGAGCEDAALEHVEDPLATWGWAYEWPTKEQWEAGTTFGRCWVTT